MRTAGRYRQTDVVEEPTQGRVDYRFLLANERTFLAWSRTALALQVAGLGVLQFLTHGHSAVRVLLGVALVTVGSATALSGYLRYRNNERAIRAGRDLPAVRSTMVLTAVVVALPLLATLGLEPFLARPHPPAPGGAERAPPPGQNSPGVGYRGPTGLTTRRKRGPLPPR